MHEFYEKIIYLFGQGKLLLKTDIEILAYKND